MEKRVSELNSKERLLEYVDSAKITNITADQLGRIFEVLVKKDLPINQLADYMYQINSGIKLKIGFEELLKAVADSSNADELASYIYHNSDIDEYDKLYPGDREKVVDEDLKPILEDNQQDAINIINKILEDEEVKGESAWEDTLVPTSGPADTVGGELIRAIEELRGNPYNYFYTADGVERGTAAPAAYLADSYPKLRKALEDIARNECEDDEYTQSLDKVFKMVVSIIIKNPILLGTKNEDDCTYGDEHMWEGYAYNYEFKCDFSDLDDHLEAGHIDYDDLYNYVYNAVEWLSSSPNAEISRSADSFSIKNVSKSDYEELDNVWYDWIDDWKERLDDSYPDGEDMDEDYRDIKPSRLDRTKVAYRSKEDRFNPKDVDAYYQKQKEENKRLFGDESDPTFHIGEYRIDKVGDTWKLSFDKDGTRSSWETIAEDNRRYMLPWKLKDHLESRGIKDMYEYARKHQPLQEDVLNPRYAKYYRAILKFLKGNKEAADIVFGWYDNEDAFEDFETVPEFRDFLEDDIYDILDAADSPREIKIVKGALGIEDEDDDFNESLKESNNPLKDAQEEHKKKQKGLSPFMNKDAGNVEAGVNFFNHVNGIVESLNEVLSVEDQKSLINKVKGDEKALNYVLKNMELLDHDKEDIQEVIMKGDFKKYSDLDTIVRDKVMGSVKEYLSQLNEEESIDDQIKKLQDERAEVEKEYDKKDNQGLTPYDEIDKMDEIDNKILSLQKQKNKSYSLNIRDALNEIDKCIDSPCFVNMYDSCILTDEDKIKLTNLVTNGDLNTIYDFLSDKMEG